MMPLWSNNGLTVYMNLHDALSRPKIRMVLVGALSVVLAYVSFLLVFALGAHYLLASVASFVTYVVLNFLLNRHWAFKSSGSVTLQATAHTSLHLFNQLLMLVGLYALVEYLHIHPAWSQAIMQVLVTVTVFTITPLIFKNR